MQREFIDQALGLLSDTAAWPAESQPRWTCEVTSPVLRWLECAGEPDVERFRAFVREGRLSLCAMQ